MTVAILVQCNMILQMRLLEERSLTNITLKLLLSSVFFHVSGHVFSRYGLAANVTICSLFGLDFVLVGIASEDEFVFLFSVSTFSCLDNVCICHTGLSAQLAPGT